MKDRRFLIGFIFFIFLVFLVNDYLGFTGNVAEGRFCEDTDDEIDVYSPGMVVSDIGLFNDRCFENLNEVREYYCVKGRWGGKYQVESKVVRCEYGDKCVKDVAGDMDACVGRFK